MQDAASHRSSFAVWRLRSAHLQPARQPSVDQQHIASIDQQRHSVNRAETLTARHDEPPSTGINHHSRNPSPESVSDSGTPIVNHTMSPARAARRPSPETQLLCSRPDPPAGACLFRRASARCLRTFQFAQLPFNSAHSLVQPGFRRSVTVHHPRPALRDPGHTQGQRRSTYSGNAQKKGGGIPLRMQVQRDSPQAAHEMSSF
jgi:hypothetical protein